MLFDARFIPTNQEIHTDICIIGAGAAGISIAKEMSESQLSVTLLESGGLSFDKATHFLNAGTGEGDARVGKPEYPLVSRLRFFGGSTNHWGGWCRPLDNIDFEKQSWNQYSGWPFSANDMEPYYSRACQYCEIQPFDYQPSDWEVSEHPFILINNEKNITTRVYHYSPPTRFGQIYRDTLLKATNVNVYLYANVTNIQPNHNVDTVSYVEVRCLTQNHFKVHAKYYILATGAIENARILLNSNKVQKEGLGNGTDLVGRNFMEHPHLDVGRICLFPQWNWTLYDSNYAFHTHQSSVLKHPIRGTLCLSENLKKKHHLLNMSMHVEAFSYPTSEKRTMDQMVCETMHHINQLTASQKAPTSPFYGELYVRSEQEPNEENRIVLTEEKDPLKQQRIKLKWKLGTNDKRSIRESLFLLAKELGTLGYGRVQDRIDDLWPDRVDHGNHHMGTTRMDTSSQQGVVDKNCQLHGVSNLFVAGSSVFPTSGFANPTLTIVALAVRLADHIKLLTK